MFHLVVSLKKALAKKHARPFRLLCLYILSHCKQSTALITTEYSVQRTFQRLKYIKI